MSKENNIDDFLKQHLTDVSESADGWNIPPDELWLNAQKQINSPKNKKRLLFWWFFGLASFVLLSVFYYHFKPNSTESEGQVQGYKPTASISREKQTREELNELNSMPSNTDVKENTMTSVENVMTESKRALNYTPSVTPKPLIAIYDAALNLDTGNALNTTHLRHASAAIDPTSTLENELLLKNDSLSLVNEPVSLIATLAFKEVESMDEEDERIQNSFSTQDSIAQKDLPWLCELGLSHSRYPENPFIKVEAQDLENNKYIKLLSSSYKSMNMVVSIPLEGRVSLSTGLYFTQQKIDVAFGLDSIIYESNDKAIEKGIKQLAASLGASSPSMSDELALRLLPSASVFDGDTLDLSGHLPIRLRAYQLPIVFNIHFGKKRIEYLISAGFSLDVIKIRVDELPVEVFENNVLVSNDINFKAFETTTMRGNLYLGGGIKYHLSEHINVGALFKFEPFTPEFSRYEVGLHYRF